MQDELIGAYQQRLLSLFSETRKRFKSTEFGAEKVLISGTIPLMILEAWRENGHINDIPFLGESVKNSILASASLIFGWEKTAYLHLRVSLESIYNGINLLIDQSAHRRYLSAGSIEFKKFNNLLDIFVGYNALTKKVTTKFKIKKEVSSLYNVLSKWSHSLGDDYFLDLSILGRQTITPKKIGEIKKNIRLLSRFAVITYLTMKPSILSDLSPANQRSVLQCLSIAERKQFRELIGV